MDALFGILLSILAPAQQRPLPAPPSAPLPPARVDPGEVRQQLAAEQVSALRRVSRSRHSVHRDFVVGWEMHHGLFLVPADARDWLRAEWVMPDFVDAALGDRLAAAAGPTGSAGHVGQRLVCHCTGAEWSFYGQPRFLVREAELTWK